jgi:ubiquinone biosynthesis protein
VKVVHDGAEAKVSDDIALMQAIASYLEEHDPELRQLRPTVLVAEFATMIGAAMDLGQELRNLQRFKANFADEPDVVIPTPYPVLSGRQVLTMALLSGGLAADQASVTAVGWDVDALVRRSAEVYMEMIFRDGLYHADPHPRNFLLPDSSHLAILDFGDVGQITSRRRRQLEDLVIAVGRRDVDEVIDIVVDLTAPPAEVDLTALRADLEQWLHRYFFVGVGELDMAGIIRAGMAILHEHKLVLPADLSLLFRVMINLQGLGRSLGTELRVVDLLQPYLSRILADRYDPRRAARHAARTVRSWERFVTELPEEMQAVLDRLKSGSVGVEFRVHDADQAVDRLVDGLITAATVIAGAELVSRRARPLIRSYSVPGLVATGIAAASWQRLLARRRAHDSLLTRTRKTIQGAHH